MRAACALLLCLAPTGAIANAAFERAVNGPLRSFEACAKSAAARPGARQACAGHLAAAQANMTRLGYTPAQAAGHVALAHDRVIAPRLRLHFLRRVEPDGRPPAVAPARAAPKPAKPAPAAPEVAPDLAAHLAEWSLCLEKARGDVLAFPVAPDMDVDGTANAIVRACDGYEARARALHVAAGRGEDEAVERVRSAAAEARAGAADEIRRRIALGAGRATASARRSRTR